MLALGHGTEALHDTQHALVIGGVLVWRLSALDVLEVVYDHQIKAPLSRCGGYRRFNIIDGDSFTISTDKLDGTVAMAEVVEALHVRLPLTTCAVALKVLSEDADVVDQGEDTELNLRDRHLRGNVEHAGLWMGTQ